MTDRHEHEHGIGLSWAMILELFGILALLALGFCG